MLELDARADAVAGVKRFRALDQFEYTVARDGEASVICEGSTELACVDLHKPERPVVMLPDEMRALFGSPS